MLPMKIYKPEKISPICEKGETPTKHLVILMKIKPDNPTVEVSRSYIYIKCGILHFLREAR